MKPIARFYSDERRSQAETVTAKVDKPANDQFGNYLCTILATGKQIRAGVSGNITAALEAGQIVILGRTDRTGWSKNTGYIILGLAPAWMKGASETPPISEIRPKPGMSVSLITPKPATLRAGGAAVTVEIYGTGFTVAPTYGSTNIVDNSAAVVTSTKITLSVKANEATTPGVYSLTLGGVTYSDVFSVLPTTARIWLGSAGDAKVRKYQPDLGQYLTSVDLSAELTSAQILIAGSAAIYVFDNSKLVKVDRASNAVTLIGTGYAAPDANRSGVLAFDAVWVTDAAGKLWKIDPTNGSVPGSVTGHSLYGVVADGSWIWAASRDGTTPGLRRIDPTTLAVTTFSVARGALTRLVDDGTYLYLTHQGTGTTGSVVKVLKSDGSISAEKTGYNEPRGLVRVGTAVYSNDGNATVRIDTSTMTETHRITPWNPAQWPDFATDGSNVWTSGQVSSVALIQALAPANLAEVYSLATDSPTNMRNIVYA